jgi:hypothetical protein
MVPIERLITPKLSRDVIKLLRGRGWTNDRVARTIRATGDFVAHVESGEQSLSERDVNALGKALRIEPLRLLFDAMGPAAMKSPMRELYESTRCVVANADEPISTTRRKTPRKRAPADRAA